MKQKIDHELKIWPQYYELVKSDIKPWEIRKNDRNYQIGDIIRFKEFDPKTNQYTGRNFVRRIMFLFKQDGFGLQKGYCIFNVIKT